VCGWMGCCGWRGGSDKDKSISEFASGLINVMIITYQYPYLSIESFRCLCNQRIYSHS
jgi:hypothetical protein